MSVKPCWNPDVLDWEGDLTGQHHGRSTPRGDLGFPVTLEADPAGFHFNLRVEFRDEQARQKFHRDLLRDAFAKFPRAQVPRERK